MRLIPRPGDTAILRLCTLSSLAFLATACVGDHQAQTGQGDASQTIAAIPRHATYDCGDGERIVIERAGNAVRLTDADGESYDLPASPPSQASRFGEGGLALVVEGGEALWMKAGKQPATCRR